MNAPYSHSCSSDDSNVHWLSTRDQAYQDRKMIKWLGFILSNHMESIKKNKEEIKKTVVRKDKQSLQTISQILKKAYDHRQMIHLQIDFIYDGEYQEDIQGVVAGFDGPYIHIRTLEDYFSIQIELIHHAEIILDEKWYR